MSAKSAERVDKRLDKVPLAHRLPTLIHPWPTLRREAPGTYRIVRYSNPFDKTTQDRHMSLAKCRSTR